jgi:hypothetical protein
MATVSISLSEDRLRMLDEMVEIQKRELSKLGIVAEVGRSSVMAKLVEDRYENIKRVGEKTL